MRRYDKKYYCFIVFFLSTEIEKLTQGGGKKKSIYTAGTIQILIYSFLFLYTIIIIILLYSFLA